MENKVRDIQEYLEKKGLVATETSIINAALEIACRRDLLYDLLFVNDTGSRKENLKQEKQKVEQVQEYLEKKGIIATETTIVNAAIDLARRWGGNAVFIGELTKRVDK